MFAFGAEAILISLPFDDDSGMGFNRRKMEDRRRQAAEKEAAARPGLGVQVFAGNCANCHDWDGKGVQSPYADLRGSRTVNDPDATNLTGILLAGSNAPLPVEHAFMPPFARPQRRRARRGCEFCQRLLRQRHGARFRGRHRQGAQGAAVGPKAP
jgi:mono/diheme cytochrome c family protein